MQQQVTLESLAKRVEALERALSVPSLEAGRKDWRRVVGMFGDSEFMKTVDAAGQVTRESERAEAKRAEPAP